MKRTKPSGASFRAARKRRLSEDRKLRGSLNAFLAPESPAVHSTESVFESSTQYESVAAQPQLLQSSAVNINIGDIDIVSTSRAAVATETHTHNILNMKPNSRIFSPILVPIRINQQL